MSPAFALMLFGKKASDPFGPPTWTVCVTRLPDVDDDPVEDVEGADDVELTVEDRVSEAAMDEDCAAAKPTRADTMKELEKYIVAVFVLRS
jgi:hypothetical protein